jgi:DNA (cytosine-5)-methyltransferase 1
MGEIRVMKFAEFFAGAGLIHEALKAHSWECVWANDICPDKMSVYQANFSSDHVHLGDIWDFVKNSAAIPDDSFLYTASFPCTDMSLAGNRKGLDGEHSGTLHALLSIIRHKKKTNSNPYLVMLENVQGFLTANLGKDVLYTVKQFNDLGYVVDLIELDAVYFSPQSRPRVFLFAVRSEVASQVLNLKGENDILDTWWSIFDNTPRLRTEKIKNIIKSNGSLKWGAFEIPAPPERTISMSDIIETKEDDRQHEWWSEERKSHLYAQMSFLHKELLKSLLLQQTYCYGTVYRRTRNQSACAELRTDGVAGCLRTPKGGSSKQILIRAGYGDWAVRLLTPREYARLQGVGDHFLLPENANKGYFAMGDAVCVPVITFISKYVLTPAYLKISKTIKK